MDSESKKLGMSGYGHWTADSVQENFETVTRAGGRTHTRTTRTEDRRKSAGKGKRFHGNRGNLEIELSKSRSSEVQRLVDTLLEGTETMVILCGSHSSMMVELTSDPVRPLYGRFPNTIELKPLSLRECAEMHPGMPDLDVLKLYLTLGGIPAFHKEAMSPAYDDCLWNAFLREQAPLQKEVQLLIGAGSP